MCKICKAFNYGIIEISQYNSTHDDYMDIPKDEYNFCFYCGSPLTAPAPLTLEQLKEMDGRPVYIIRVEADEEKTNKSREGWYLVDCHFKRVYSSQFNSISFDEMFKIFDTAAGLSRFGFNAYTHQPPAQPAMEGDNNG